MTEVPVIYLMASFSPFPESIESSEFLHLSLRAPRCRVETETRKDFCGETSHQRLPVIRVILHLGPLGYAGEHTLHYLDGQSLRNPTVFGPAE